MRISDWSSDVCSSDLLACNPGLYWRGRDRAAHGIHPLVCRFPRDGQTCMRGHHAEARMFDKPIPRAAQPGIEEAGKRHAHGCEVLSVKIAQLFVGGVSFHQVVEVRTEEHTSELQSLMRNSYDGF